MEVWLVRHAIAADQAPNSTADEDRPLTEHGQALFNDLADSLARHVKMPGCVASSPLVRAVQTAELLCRASGIKKKELLITDVLAPGVSVHRLLEYVQQREVDRIALVGHEPDMSRCTSQLIGGGSVSFGKGNIACIRFTGALEAGAGELRWFLSPKLL